MYFMGRKLCLGLATVGVLGIGASLYGLNQPRVYSEDFNTLRELDSRVRQADLGEVLAHQDSLTLYRGLIASRDSLYAANEGFLEELKVEEGYAQRSSMLLCGFIGSLLLAMSSLGSYRIRD